MFRLFLVALVILMYGCAKTDNPVSDSAKEEVTTLAQEPAATGAPSVVDASLGSSQEVAIPQEAASQDQIPDVVKMTGDLPKKTKAAAAQSPDEVIANGAWGFSVYNPADQTTEYYNSSGSFLGKR